MGHAQIQTTQKYLHALPEADQRNLDAFRRIAELPDMSRPFKTGGSAPLSH